MKLKNEKLSVLHAQTAWLKDICISYPKLQFVNNWPFLVGSGVT